MNTRVRLTLLAVILIATTSALYLTTGPEAYPPVITVRRVDIVLVGILLVVWVINPWLPRFEPWVDSLSFSLFIRLAHALSLGERTWQFSLVKEDATPKVKRELCLSSSHALSARIRSSWTSTASHWDATSAKSSKNVWNLAISCWR